MLSQRLMHQLFRARRRMAENPICVAAQKALQAHKAAVRHAALQAGEWGREGLFITTMTTQLLCSVK